MIVDAAEAAGRDFNDPTFRPWRHADAGSDLMCLIAIGSWLNYETNHAHAWTGRTESRWHAMNRRRAAR